MACASKAQVMRHMRIQRGYGIMLTLMALLSSSGASVASSDEVTGDAGAPESCSVTTGTNPDCTFSCSEGDKIEVSAGASQGTVSISGSCGNRSIECTTTSNCAAGSESTTAGGMGTCHIEEKGAGEDAGTGSCGVVGGKTEDEDEEIHCDVEVPGVACVILAPESGLDALIELIVNHTSPCAPLATNMKWNGDAHPVEVPELGAPGCA